MFQLIKRYKRFPIKKIIRNEFQKQEKGNWLFNDLVESVKVRGVVGAITLTDTFQLACGNQRVMASKKVGRKTIPAEIYKMV